MVLPSAFNRILQAACGNCLDQSQSNIRLFLWFSTIWLLLDWTTPQNWHKSNTIVKCYLCWISLSDMKWLPPAHLHPPFTRSHSKFMGHLPITLILSWIAFSAASFVRALSLISCFTLTRKGPFCSINSQTIWFPFHGQRLAWASTWNKFWPTE